MNQIIPDMYANVIPEKSIANINLGLKFEEFIRKAKHQLVEEDKFYKDYYNSSSTHDTWYVLHIKGMSSVGKAFDSYSARWDNDLILEFTGTQQKVLTGIVAQHNYRGALFNKLRINDRLDKMLDDFDLDFWGDSHWLVDKNNTSNNVSVQIATDFLVSYEDEPNQIVQGFYITMSNEEKDEYGITV